MKIAVYPGSFDPLTNGHIEIIKRSLSVFDKLIVVVASNPLKKHAFTIEERLEMLREATKNIPNIEVDFTEGLTVKYARTHGAVALVRGLRAVTDFEFEFQMAAANEFIDNGIEMVFLMSRAESGFISSSTVKELYKNGVDITPLVPESVVRVWRNKK